jgi:hypothetical protein
MPTIQETIQKVREFEALPLGWHFGDGVPPSREGLKSAQILLTRAEGLDFRDADAFPGADGEIQIAIYRADDDYEFTIERNGTITFAHDKNGKEIAYQPGLLLEEAVETLVQLSDRTWLSLDFSTTNTMIRIEDDFVVLLSGTPATGRAYQLSIANVLSIPAGQSVSISPDFTLLWPENQLSIGQSLTTLSQPGASSSKRIVNLAIDATTTFKTGQIRTPGGSLKRCA